MAMIGAPTNPTASGTPLSRRLLDEDATSSTGRVIGTIYRAIQPVSSGSHNDAMTDREDLWDAVHEALPAGWRVGPPTFDLGVPGWSVTAA